MIPDQEFQYHPLRLSEYPKGSDARYLAETLERVTVELRFWRDLARRQQERLLADDPDDIAEHRMRISEGPDETVEYEWSDDPHKIRVTSGPVSWSDGPEGEGWSERIGNPAAQRVAEALAKDDRLEANGFDYAALDREDQAEVEWVSRLKRMINRHPADEVGS